MHSSVKINNGKCTFGVFKEPLNAGDFILNKKAKTTFCSNVTCNQSSRTLNTQSNKLLFKQANYLNSCVCAKYFNTANLNVNLLTTLDLTNISVISSNNSPYASPTPITTTTTPYLDYQIDPSGNLFGNTNCGLLNYETDLVFNTST